MKVIAAILAAGRSTRLGTDKTLATLGNCPVWKWSYDVYRSHPLVDEVMVVVSDQNQEEIALTGAKTILGGSTRQESARIALEASRSYDAILFHDAGRPFVTPEMISDTIAAIEASGAAGVSIPVKDTIRLCGDNSSTCLDRSRLVAMQTPQGGLTDLFIRAHTEASDHLTDDLALIENLGITPALVEGSERNFKITTLQDLNIARRMVHTALPRIGSGYDVHAFSDDKDRVLWLGGVRFDGARALEGHSDADALLHAVVDSLLGAAALGDIGQHFPNTDSEWKDAPSIRFVEAARDMLATHGWQIVNVDSTVIAEEPKVMKRAHEIRETIARGLGIGVGQVSIKATTNEKMGFIGRSEGIAAFATAMIAPLEW